MTTQLISRLNKFGYKKTYEGNYEGNDESHYQLRTDAGFVDVHIDEKEVKFRNHTIRKRFETGSEEKVQTLRIPHEEESKILAYLHAFTPISSQININTVH